MADIIRNSYYMENHNRRNDEIEERVKKMMNEPVYPQYSNLTCANAFTYFPEANHKVLGIIGNYKSSSSPVVPLDGEITYPDQIELVGHNFKGYNDEIFVGIEYLKYAFSQKKTQLVKGYVGSTAITKRPGLMYVVTDKMPNIQYPVSINDIVFDFRFVIYDTNLIYKNLNNMLDKDYTTVVMSEEEIVQMHHGMAFVNKQLAQDCVRQKVDIFTSIEEMDLYNRIILFNTMKENVKYQFQYNLEEKRRLLTMMSESIPEGFFPPMDAMQLHKHAFNILTNRNKRLNGEISQLNSENNYLNGEISQLNSRIAKLEAENRKLRKNNSS